MDSNYHSYANPAVCQTQGLDAYIPDLHFRKRDQRFAQSQRIKDAIRPRRRPSKKGSTFAAADFRFDASQNVFLCPQGKGLKRGARIYGIYRAGRNDRASCPLRRNCLSKPNTSRRFLLVEIHARRLVMIEPAFTNLHVQKRLDHFTARTKPKADVKCRLIALVHNNGKIHRYGLLQCRKKSPSAKLVTPDNA